MTVRTNRVLMTDGGGGRKTAAKKSFFSGLATTAKAAINAKKASAAKEPVGFMEKTAVSVPKAAATKTAAAAAAQIVPAVKNAAKTAGAAAKTAGEAAKSAGAAAKTTFPAAQSNTAAPTASEPAGGETLRVPTFESLFREMLERYAPETVAFTPIDEDVLRETIVEWLRPAYEQAIERRREQTARGNAELDADAWARGMGASTYVTDVKERALRSESRDVGELESDYASALAGHLYDALKSQQEQQVEVDRFNAEQQNLARERASDAALKLYETYLDAAQAQASSAAPAKSGTGSGGGTAIAKQAQKSVNDAAKAFVKAAKSGNTAQTAGIDLNTAISLIARLTPEERGDLYAGRGAYAQQYREILDGVGSDAFAALMRKYPAA